MKTKFRLMIIPAVIFGILFFSSESRAQKPGARTHDGFYLRMLGGLGVAVASTDTPDNLELNVYGGAAQLDFSIGGIIARNLALHGSLFTWTIADPTFELKSSTGSISDESEHSSANLFGIGIGATYFFMPINLYLSGTLATGQFSIEFNEVIHLEGSTDSGFIFRFLLGKEWWVGDNWGLGLAGVFDLFAMPDESEDLTWGGVNLGLLFSATYN